MKKNKFKWLSLEPYVHGVVKNNSVLLYNTVNKQHLICRNAPEIAAIVQQLLDPSNGYVCPIGEEQVILPVINDFIGQLRKKYMGDLLEPEWSSSKPFNIVPEPVIKKGSQTLELNLHEITVHLNTGNDIWLELYKDASRQFTFPVYSGDSALELSPDLLQSVYSQIASLPFATLNFVGSGIFNAYIIDRVSSIFSGTSFRRKFHMPLFQLELNDDYSQHPHDWLSIYITLPFNEIQFEKLNRLLKNQEKIPRIECYFIVQKSEEIDLATEIIGQLSIKQAYFKPYFTGKNMKFFEDHVFITEDDIKVSRPSQNQVFSRVTMNENDFGKLIILPDGTVFANLNDESLGNMTDESLENIIRKELTSGKSWNRIRTVVEPCNDCIFNFLCPPVSNYEIRINRFNFCHIYP